MSNFTSKYIDLSNISTEGVNHQTKNIDTLKTIQLVHLINKQDQSIALAVKSQLKNIAIAIDKIVYAFNHRGRLIYIGAGTSGRLGVLDASEMPPTYGVSDKLVIGLIAGGDAAIRKPIEGAEDNQLAVINDLKDIRLNKRDVLVGISASGRTPYVVSGLIYANKLGCQTISIATSHNSEIGKIAKIKIEAITGPETIVGSTRMKSGTAQKMILNTLSTGAMIKIGKVFSNLMVDVQPTNLKLVTRAFNLVKRITKANDKDIKKIMSITHNQVKPAVIMIKKNLNYGQAKQLLKKHRGMLRECLK
ncbi:MAG: N-acetylmuramic acid 6-phosphate etherase [Mycoplasmataceae bacterium]|jgi:N-acetylmuramic acid 6-phosphate etherase|nr:N-acetylmuramic acid 6-phosphate etherase [Mycoplasmataceae bacterium]